MARGVHHKAALDLLASVQSYVNGSWDAIRILVIVFLSTMLKCNFLHECTCVCIIQSLMSIVIRREHQLLPCLIHCAWDRTMFHCFLQNARNDESHGMVSRLALCIIQSL